MAMKFKLLVGQHIGPDLSKEPDPVTGKRPSKTWTVVNGRPVVVESEIDLVKKHGASKFAYMAERGVKAGSAKRELPRADEIAEKTGRSPKDVKPSEVAPVDDEEDEGGDEAASTEPNEEELNSMKLNELKAYASEKDIDLSHAKSKHDVVAAILASRSAPADETEEETEEEEE